VLVRLDHVTSFRRKTRITALVRADEKLTAFMELESAIRHTTTV
jgi:hypothetical protein